MGKFKTLQTNVEDNQWQAVKTAVTEAQAILSKSTSAASIDAAKNKLMLKHADIYLKNQKTNGKFDSELGYLINTISGFNSMVSEKKESKIAGFLQNRLDALENKRKNEFVEETPRLRPGSTQPKPADLGLAAAQSTQVEGEIRTLVNSFSSVFTSYVSNPESFYSGSRNDNIPAFGSSLDFESLKNYDNENGGQLGKKIAAKIVEQLKTNLADFPYADALIEKLEAKVKGGGNVSDLQNAAEASFRELNTAQRAMDGLTIAIKSRYMGKPIGMQYEQFAQFFASTLPMGDSHREADIRALMDRKTSPEEFQRIAGKVFDNLNVNSFTGLAIDANYGEKAALLDRLIAGLRGVEYDKKFEAEMNGKSSLGKAREFFTLAAGGLGDYAKPLKELFRQRVATASSLINDVVQVPATAPPSSATTRDRYDLATVLSFAGMYGDENSEVFRDERLKDGDIKNLLGAMTQSGAYRLPNTVTCSLLQNHKAIDFLYRNLNPETGPFKATEDELSQDLSNYDAMKMRYGTLQRFVADLAARSANIYSSPFGTSFTIDTISSETTESRKTAVDVFLGRVSMLPDNKVLSDLISRYIASGRPPISFLGPEEMLHLYPSAEDFLNIQNRLGRMQLSRFVNESSGAPAT